MMTQLDAREPRRWSHRAIVTAASVARSWRMENLERKVLRSREEFLGLAHDWQRILSQNGDTRFYASFDWFAAQIGLAQDAPRDLEVLVFSRRGEIVGICPCHIRARKLRRLPVRAFELIGNVYSPERTLIVREGFEEAVARGLLDYLQGEARARWDVLRFEGLAERSAMRAHLEAEAARRGIAGRCVVQFANLVTDFTRTRTPRAFFSSLSANMRQMIRSKMNRLNRQGVFDILLVTSPEHDLQRAFDDYYAIYGESWKKSESDPHFHRRLGLAMAEKGALRLFVLYYRPGDGAASRPFASIDSPVQANRPIPRDYVPLAATLFLVHEGCGYFLKTAYREGFAELSPGTVLFWFTMQHLLGQDAVALIDHQIGDEAYKLRWGGAVREQRVLYQAYNPRSLRAAVLRALSIARSGAHLLDRVASHAARLRMARSHGRGSSSAKTAGSYGPR